MHILGISCFYHDSSACILKDGILIAAAAEERFSRKKHDTSFPERAIRFCLKQAQITIAEVDYISFYEKPFLKFERLLYQHLEMFPFSFFTFFQSMPSWINEKLRVTRIIKKRLRYKGDIFFIPHHMAHAASYLVSPFKEAAILTMDGVGEWTTTACGYAKGSNIELRKEIRFPHSIGLLYSTVTAYLGMRVNNSEYKCLHPNTRVLFSGGNTEKIEDLFRLKGKQSKLSETEDILKLESKIELISLDKKTLKLVPHQTDIIYRKKVNTQLYEIELFSGRKVTVTPNHRFTTVSSFGEVLDIEAKDLSKDDFVAIPKRISTKGNLNKDYLYWARLLAYSISEGHELLRKEKNEAEIRIGTTNKLLIENIKKTVEAMGKTYRVWKDKKRRNMFYIGISVWKDLGFLEVLGYEFGRRAGTKSIPKFIMLSKGIQKDFLSNLFDCDGGFIGHQLIYATKSETLADQISYLLLNFGIHSRIRRVLNKRYNQYYYRLEINGKYLKDFDKKIGFNLKEKAKKLRKYIMSVKRFGNNIEFIPINGYILNRWLVSGRNKRQLYQKIKYHFWDYETKKKYATEQLLERANKLLKDEKITKFLNSDIFFDRIKSIKKVKFKGYVYDVLMPKHHSFVGGKGAIILHNTMGLAPYGAINKEKNPYYNKLKQVIDIKEDGSFNLDMSYFVFHYKASMPSKKLCKLLGGPIRKPGSELSQRHKDVAAALQMITEEVIIKMLNYLHKEVKCYNIVISGGVGLNSVANGKILRNTPFKDVWLQPDPGDGGTSIGAAFYAYNVILGEERKYVLDSASLGPEFSDSEIKEFLDKNKIKYSEFRDYSELIKNVAKLIYDNNVVGWFQGRMEWGPRALGNRSILSNPCNPKMQDILNLKVKHRERFRPFAPVVCEDDALDYFECDKPIPLPTDFMLMVYPIKEDKRKIIPAVTQVDGSGRLQIIRLDQNENYYKLIKEFGKLSKVPILINTSFNIRGEPIVCAPYDAYKCMMGTGIDYLIIGWFLVKRDDNKKDMWDSEKYVKD